MPPESTKSRGGRTSQLRKLPGSWLCWDTHLCTWFAATGKGRHHGSRPTRPEPGRRSSSVCSVPSNMPIEVPCNGKEIFFQHEKVQPRVISIWHQFYSREKGYSIFPLCNYCADGTVKRGLRGYSIYEPAAEPTAGEAARERPVCMRRLRSMAIFRPPRTGHI